LGLGLAIVRNLVTSHGGSVSAHSDGPGKGSEFRVRFPLTATRADNVTSESSKTSEVAPAIVKRRVLIVDDNADGAELLEFGLQALGHETRVARDGPEALVAAQEFHPEVALLDIGLPIMNGYELAREMRKLLAERTPILFAVTGYGQDSDRKKSYEAGFEQHLVKPIDLGALARLIGSTELRR
jgi:CheY-like chemotaxis protein